MLKRQMTIIRVNQLACLPVEEERAARVFGLGICMLPVLLMIMTPIWSTWDKMFDLGIFKVSTHCLCGIFCALLSHEQLLQLSNADIKP